MLVPALIVLGAYLLGSVASAIVVARLLGLPDPRTVGSRNPGATNVLRTGGRGAAALTLAGDMLKGLVPPLAALALDGRPAVAAAAAVAAFLGHLYPVFFGFRGGKGVATTLGALLGLSWPAGLATVATWLAVAAAFRYSSLAAIVAALLAPGWVWWLAREPAYVAAAAVMAVLLLWRHRGNMARLLAGTEDRIGSGKR